MKVACEHCGAVYDVQEEKVPPEGMTMKCPKCLSSFKVMPPLPNPGLAKGRTIMGLGLSPDGGVILPDGQNSASPPVDTQGGKPPSASGKAPAPSPKGSGTIIGSPGRPVGGPAPQGANVPIGSGPDVSLFVKRYTGRVFGPFPADTILVMLQGGKLDGSEEVSEDRQEWQPIKEHPALAGAIGADVLDASGSSPPPTAGADHETDLPEPKRVSDGRGLDVPKPASARASRPAPQDLPQPRGATGAQELDLPQPRGTTGPRKLDLPQPRGATGARELDLPQPKGATGARELDLPQPKAGPGGPPPPPPPPPVPGLGGDLPTPKDSTPDGSLGDDLPIAMHAADEGSGPPPLDLPEPKGPEAGGGGASSGSGLDLSELDLVAPKDGGAGSLPDLGAQSLDLGELDLVAPKSDSGSAAAGLDLGELTEGGEQQAESGAEGAEAAEAAQPAESPSVGAMKSAAGPGLVARLGWKLWAIAGGAAVVVVGVVLWLFVFGPSGGSKGSAAHKSASQPTARRPGQSGQALPAAVDRRRLDTVEAYRKARSAAYRAWKKSGKDPVLAGIAAQCVLSAKLRYNDSWKVPWVKKQVKAAVSGGTKHPDLTKAQALVALVSGKKKASKLLKPACSKSHQDAWACVYLSWARWKQGKFALAEKAASRARKAQGDNVAALFARGRARAMLGDDKGAKKDFEAVLAKSKDHLEAKIELVGLQMRSWVGDLSASKNGLALQSRFRSAYDEAKASGVSFLVGLARLVKMELYLLQGKEDKAIGQAAKAAKLRPEPRTWTALGQRQLAYGRYLEAQGSFDKALKEWPHFQSAIEGKANALVAMGQADSALALVRQVWDRFPKAPWIRVLRGDINLARGKPDSAEKYYKKAIALDSRYVPAYVAWLKLRASSDPVAGLAQIEQLSAQGLDHPDLVFMKGELFAAQKKWPQAVAAYRKALETAPFDNRYTLALGRALLAQGKVEAGLEYIEKVWKRAKGHKDVALVLADHYMKAGALDRALSVLAEAALVRPTVPVKLALAEAALNKGGPKGVSRGIKIAAALALKRPLDARVRKVLGHAYLLAKRPDDALAQFKKGAAALDKDLDVLLWSARAYLSLGQTGRALAVLHQALKLYPKSARLLEFRSEIAISRGDVRAALKDLVKAVKIRPSAKAYTLQAVCYLERQRSSKALRVLTKAVKLDPEYARAHFLLGRVYYQTTRLRKAVASLRKALTLAEEARPDWLADAYYMLGAAYVDLRNKPEARRYLRKYLAVTKGQSAREKTRQEAKRKLRRLSN